MEPLTSTLEYVAILRRRNYKGKHILLPQANQVNAEILPEAPIQAWVLDELEKFRSWAKKCGHEHGRIELSIRRVLAPLCWSRRTSGIERGWYDLTQKERRSVIKMALAAEKIWLGENPRVR
jgi:hypothetical protein